jgi:hypothetical protein
MDLAWRKKEELLSKSNLEKNRKDKPDFYTLDKASQMVQNNLSQKDSRYSKQKSLRLLLPSNCKESSSLPHLLL